jgi:hypothetical protein
MGLQAHECGMAIYEALATNFLLMQPKRPRLKASR